MIPLSVLDLAPVPEGGDAGQALRNALDLARHAEALGTGARSSTESGTMPTDMGLPRPVGSSAAGARHLAGSPVADHALPWATGWDLAKGAAR